MSDMGGRLIEMDGVSAEQIKAPPTSSAALDPDHTTRQEVMRQAAIAGGIDWPETRVPAGEGLIRSGMSRLKSDRQRFERLPKLVDAAPTVAAKLASEDRRDFPFAVSKLRLDGKTARVITKAGSDGAGYSDHAFRQLVAQIPGMRTADGAPRGFASSVLYLNPQERAQVVNARIDKSEAEVTLRTRLADDGTRFLRAVLSERYGDLQDLHIANMLSGALGGDGAKLDYKPGESNSRFEILWPSEIPVETFRVGDVHYAGVQILNSETAQGRAVFVPFLERAACYNLTLATGLGVEVNLTHLGDAVRLAAKAKAAINQCIAQVEPLIEAITVSARTPLPEGKSPAEMLRAIAKKFEVPRERVQAWEGLYLSKYAQSPTLWGVTSAITDAAQELPWWRQQQEEEEVAAQLVTVGWRAVAN